jgi:hypothetical protein
VTKRRGKTGLASMGDSSRRYGCGHGDALY